MPTQRCIGNVLFIEQDSNRGVQVGSLCTSVLDRWMKGLFRIFDQKSTTVFLLTHYFKIETRFGAGFLGDGGGNQNAWKVFKSSKELNIEEFLNLSGILYPLLPTTISKMSEKIDIKKMLTFTFLYVDKIPKNLINKKITLNIRILIILN